MNDYDTIKVRKVFEISIYTYTHYLHKENIFKLLYLKFKI